jgi:hypothetical protein
MKKSIFFFFYDSLLLIMTCDESLRSAVPESPTSRFEVFCGGGVWRATRTPQLPDCGANQKNSPP